MTFKYRYRKQIIITCTCLLIVSSLVFFYFYKKPSKNTKIKTDVLKSDEIKKKKEPVKKEEEKEIMVDVKGEVNTSGIFTLKEGSRVIDAINMAGGLTKNADTSVLNLSKKLTDEMVIVVYSYYEVKNFEKTKEVENTVRENCKTAYEGVENSACITSENDSTAKTGKISLNNATLEELMTLTGIGEAKAKNIIEYREKNGGFKEVEELKKVTGIGDALFDKVKENITL